MTTEQASARRTTCRDCGQVILQRTSDGLWFSQGVTVPVTSDCNEAADGLHVPSNGNIDKLAAAHAEIARLRSALANYSTGHTYRRLEADVEKWRDRALAAEGRITELTVGKAVR